MKLPQYYTIICEKYIESLKAGDFRWPLDCMSDERMSLVSSIYTKYILMTEYFKNANTSLLLFTANTTIVYKNTHAR